ncbi:hypothetical protein FRC14_005279 [Serendipita sp. 396]|nr:hypothetical protein FRC14_005279 [Serendipita sp. 396]
MTTPQIAADALIKEMGNSPDEITRTQASGFRQVHEAGINRRRGEPFFVLLVRVLRQALSLQSEIPMSYAAEGRASLIKRIYISSHRLTAQIVRFGAYRK